jgi:hypothetical protein
LELTTLTLAILDGRMVTSNINTGELDMCKCPCETNELKLEVDTPKSISLQVGRTYLNRKGEKVLVIYDRGFEYANPHSRFICVDLKSKYTSSRSVFGRCMADEICDQDLIKEYSEEDERKEKMQKYVDWVKSLKVDDKVEVKDYIHDDYGKRHFSMVSSKGFMCWDYGKTSFTEVNRASWGLIKHPDGTEIKFNDIKEWL